MPLFNDVLSTLDKTSSEVDQTTLEKINLIIAKGKQHLREFFPTLTDEDFEDNNNSAKFLLLNFCRYDFSNASEMFDVNYKQELINLRQKYEVSEYENKNT